MADEKKADDRDQSARSGDTAAGQEANRGLPEQHDRERQSNYGGGGTHGGQKGGEKKED